MDDITGVFGSLGQVNTGAVLFDIILTTLASMALGVLITLFYAYMNRKKGFTLEFSVTIIAISSVIAMIIAVIGTNIASAFSLAGIMSIVRFRSLQQKTSDIAFLFVAMAAGLTAGLGLLLPALAFVVLTGVPESMSFDGQFDEVLRKHTLSYDLKRVRLISSGTVMELAYTVNLKDLSGVSALLSDIREKNSNFNVVLMYDADDER